MRFGPVPIDAAIGGVVAHAFRHGDAVLRKGTIIGPEQVALLRQAGVTEIVVALAEPGDLGENDAAAQLAAAFAGPGVSIEAPFTGRANLFAGEAGLLRLDEAAIHAVNAIDEAITLATLPPMRSVRAGEMVGTVKIIPFAVAGGLVAEARSCAGAGNSPPIAVAPYRPLRVAVISTLLPGLKPAIVDKTLAVLAERLLPLAGSRIVGEVRIAHAPEALAQALKAFATPECDLVIVFGASAITDRRDVIPAAIEAAGGRIEHLGMPVDPGNLLLLGHLGNLPVIGAPGCARSPKENGFDWVLQRLAAGLPVTRADIQHMGVGGLLMEIVSRPQPRAPAAAAGQAQIGALVLAAGRSTRMGTNKLLAPLAGKPVVRHVVEAALASRARPVVVVTGHQQAEIEAALHGLDVRLVHNPAHAGGMSTSLKAGMAALDEGHAGCVVLLGDMPLVTPRIIDQLIDSHLAQPAAMAVVPLAGGRRGNPVLITAALRPALAVLDGDVGAKALLQAAGDDVLEVTVAHDGVLIDVDTPEALERARSLAAEGPAAD